MTFLPTSSSKASVHFVIPKTSTFHMLPQHRSSQWSVVLQEQTTPVLVPHRLNFLPASGSCMCSSAQAPAPTRSLLQHGLLRGCKFIQGISTCSSVESSKAGLQVSSPQWSFMCCRGSRASLLFSPVAARGISAPVHGTPPAPPLTLVSTALYLSHFTHFSLSQLCSGFALS